MTSIHATLDRKPEKDRVLTCQETHSLGDNGMLYSNKAVIKLLQLVKHILRL